MRTSTATPRRRQPAPPAGSATSATLALRRFDRALAPWLPLLILLVAAGLRFYKISGQSLWADEGNSAALAIRSFSQISQAAAADIHPPLYYWLLSVWVRILGTSEVALRGLSALAGVVTVWLVYLLGRRLFGRVAGLLAAFLLALAPLHVYYAQEARMYSLLTLWATLMLLAFVMFLQNEMEEIDVRRREAPLVGTNPGFLYVVAAIAGLYTHYLFPILLLAANLIYLAWLAGTWQAPYRRLRIFRWIFLHLVILMGYWAWLGIGLQRILAWPAPAVTQQGWPALAAALSLLAFGPTHRGVPPVWLFPVAALLLAGLLPLGNGLMATFTPRAQTEGTRPAAAWTAWAVPVLWLVAPVGLMLGLNLFKEAYLKFLVVASPALALLTARGLLLPLALLREQRAGAQAAPRRVPAPGRASAAAALIWFTLGLAGVAVGPAYALNTYYNNPRYARDDYRAIAAYIASVAGPQDAVLLNAAGQRDVFDYYYQGNLPVLALPAQRPADTQATVESLTAGLSGRRRVYALLWATDESDPKRIVESWLDRNAYKVQDTWQGNVRLVIYSMPHSDSAPVRALDLDMGGLARLQGVSISGAPVPSGDILEITLVWQTERTTDQHYKVFLQLLDQNNQVVAQRDAEPVGESRPTTTWQAGETIVDRHGLLVPPGTPPGTYHLIAGLYNRDTGTRLAVGNADAVNLDDIEVVRPVTLPPPEAFSIAIPRHIELGNLLLLGYNRYPRGYAHAPETALHAGDLLHLDLFWQAENAPQTDWFVVVSLGDLPGTRVIEARGRPAGSAYPTTQWEVGEIVRGQVDLTLPADVAPGAYPLHLALYAAGAVSGNAVTLGTINIQ